MDWLGSSSSPTGKNARRWLASQQDSNWGEERPQMKVGSVLHAQNNPCPQSLQDNVWHFYVPPRWSLLP